MLSSVCPRNDNDDDDDDVDDASSSTAAAAAAAANADEASARPNIQPITNKTPIMAKIFNDADDFFIIAIACSVAFMVLLFY